MYLFSFIIFLELQQNKKKHVFSKEYKRGYKKLWINSIRDYSP